MIYLTNPSRLIGILVCTIIILVWGKYLVQENIFVSEIGPVRVFERIFVFNSTPKKNSGLTAILPKFIDLILAQSINGESGSNNF